MLPAGSQTLRRAARMLALWVILAAAAAARLWYLAAGVPHAVGIDEPQVIDRAIRILRTGDWNPHVFDYPTLVIYAHAVVAIARFLSGALRGEWASLDGFSAAAIYGSGRLFAGLIGVATVWLTYRLGSELASRRLGLLAAAQVALQPQHVRESHFILSDVPMTALTTLAIWLAVRAARLGTVGAYAVAGAASGLAAAAKYNGGLVLIAVAVAWLIEARSSPDRLRKAGAALGGAALAFLLGAPYTLLDMPAFLDGFAAQFARFAGPSRGEPAWLLYLKHLSHAGWVSLPIGVAGIAILLWRPDTRRRWAPVIAFAALYFYALSSHSNVFGRYVLPLVPVLSLFTSIAILELLELFRRLPALSRPVIRGALLAAAVVLLLYPAAAVTIGWLDDVKRTDTRTLAAEWLKSN